NVCQGRQGYHVPLGGPGVEEPDVLRLTAVRSLGLDVDFVHPAEPVEVVHISSAEEAAQRVVHILELESQLEHSVTIHVREELRNVRTVGREGAANFGALHGGLNEPLSLLGEVLG